MTQTPEAASAKVTKLNRVERNAWTKQKIFDAATKVVGKYGYAEASVARITEQAGVAQGTFYNHFENRQELLDQLPRNPSGKVLKRVLRAELEANA